MTTLAIFLAALVYFLVYVLVLMLVWVKPFAVLLAMTAAYWLPHWVCSKSGNALLAIRTFATIVADICLVILLVNGMNFIDLLAVLCCIAMWILTFVKKH